MLKEIEEKTDIAGNQRHHKIVSYASENEGHKGTIYKAANFERDGWSNGGRDFRDGRKNEDNGRKRRFVYPLVDRSVSPQIVARKLLEKC